VFVDPGHGGLDPGAEGATSAGTRVYEKTLTLAVAQDLTETFRRDGYGVVLSRTGDSSVAQLPPGDINGGALTPAGEHLDTIARVACANSAGAAALVSIHFNAFDDASVGGAETYYDDARPFTTQNQHLGTLVQQGLVLNLHAAGWPVPDRGVLADSDTGAPALTAEGAAYGHLLELGPAQNGWIAQPSQMPGVLVEPVFITRPTEADLAATPAGQQAMARGLAQALEAFLAGR
jgi:N-acetylmuramoyl-L-alanine amidase